MKYLFTCLFLFSFCPIYSQDDLSKSDEVIKDSYKKAIKFLDDRPDSTIAILSRNLAQDIQDTNLRMENYNVRGVAYYYSAMHKEALDDLFKVLNYSLSNKDTLNIISNRSNIALVLANMGNYSQALKYLIASEKLIENEEKNVYLYTNLGYIYENLEEYGIALEYHQKSLRLDSIIQDSSGIALDYINIGVQYLKVEKFDKAKFYLKKGKTLATKLNDQRSLGLSLLNLGALFTKTNDFQRSIDYLSRCIEIADQTDNHSLSVKAHNDKAKALGFGLGKLQEAIDISLKGLQRASNYEIIGEIGQLNKMLYELYKKDGQPTLAIDHLEKFTKIQDSLDQINKSRKFIAYELEYRFEKEVLKDSLENAKLMSIKDLKIKKQENEVQQKNNQLIIGIVGLSIFGLLSILLFGRYRITNKQKKVISLQNVNLEKKRKEISDSITYAERIQNTILPKLSSLPRFINDYFLYFQPKDVVSGDFYWVESKNNKTYIAVADCTGHGVPGAMVSVFCSRALTHSLMEEEVTSVDDILERTRTIITNQFLSDDSTIKDGMDISLISLEAKGSNKYALEFAGANNALMIATNSNVSKQLLTYKKLEEDSYAIFEIPSDKQPVGFSFDPQPFSKCSFELTSQTRLFLLTDGYQDQFGGDNGKKIKRSAMRKLLLDSKNSSMRDQKSMLKYQLDQWMLDEEQVDDICILAIEL